MRSRRSRRRRPRRAVRPRSPRGRAGRAAVTARRASQGSRRGSALLPHRSAMAQGSPGSAGQARAVGAIFARISCEEGLRRHRFMRQLTTITNALADKQLLGAALGDPSSWTTWRSVMKAAYAESLTAVERVAFDQVAGGRAPPTRKAREVA